VSDAFISYSSKDKNAAEAACAAIEGAGIRCWIAPRDILPGVVYADALLEALDNCRVMVLIFSASANESPQVRREVERVASRGIPIVPLRIEDVKPTKSMAYFVDSLHWLDAFTPPLERHFQRLADSVNRLLRGFDRGELILGHLDKRGAQLSAATSVGRPSWKDVLSSPPASLFAGLSKEPPEVSLPPLPQSSLEAKSQPKIVACSDIGFAHYHAWTRDWRTCGRSADGIMTEGNLRKCIDTQQSERSRLYGRGESTRDIDYELETSRRLLSAMNRWPVTEIAYVPKNILELPIGLRRVYVELLNLDTDRNGASTNHLGEISQEVFDNARSRYRSMPQKFESQKARIDQVLVDIDNLARRLGMF
jgi:hypothetical protein